VNTNIGTSTRGANSSLACLAVADTKDQILHVKAAMIPGTTSTESGATRSDSAGSPLKKATVPVVIPQKGQGTPVSALNGQTNGSFREVQARSSPIERTPANPVA
jgi:hypothetical protein